MLGPRRGEARREARFRREAKARGFRLEPGDWRWAECGCVAEEAVARISREGRPLAAGVMMVCSPDCYRARVNRRTAALMREKQRTPEAKG